MFHVVRKSGFGAALAEPVLRLSLDFRSGLAPDETPFRQEPVAVSVSSASLREEPPRRDSASRADELIVITRVFPI